tara:strand:- start:781 stop:1173 length:393 start_codon:yes stop_codon:yes gene_type:complete
MMEFVTNNTVAHIDIDTMINGGTTTGLVTLKTGAFAFIVSADNEVRVEVAYQYEDANGVVLPTAKNGVFVIDDKILGTNYVKNVSLSINSDWDSFDNIVDRLESEVEKLAISNFVAQFSELVDATYITKV